MLSEFKDFTFVSALIFYFLTVAVHQGSYLHPHLHLYMKANLALHCVYNRKGEVLSLLATALRLVLYRMYKFVFQFLRCIKKAAPGELATENGIANKVVSTVQWEFKGTLKNVPACLWRKRQKLTMCIFSSILKK